MLQIERLRDIRTGEALAGFKVKNRVGRIVAFGADRAYLRMTAGRYENDADLVRACERIAGVPATCAVGDRRGKRSGSGAR
jgi:hypothetical protein